MAVMVGNDDVFNYCLYPETPKTFTNYLQQNMASLSDRLGGLNNSFVDMTRKMFAKNNDEKALAAARSIAEAGKMLFDMNIIQLLMSIQDIQNAKPLMQRFIMAMPEMTQLHNDQKIESYFGSFVDQENGAVGENRLDYRKVMDGIVTINTEGYTSWTHYYDDPISDGDVELTVRNQFNILETWDSLAAAIAQGIDPSSHTGGMIAE